MRAVSPLSDGKSPAPKSKATPSVRLSSQPVSEHHLNHVDSFRYRGYHACNQYLDGLGVALSEVQSVPYRLILIYTPQVFKWIDWASVGLHRWELWGICSLKKDTRAKIG
jgi:hypothetical protein